MSASKSAIRNPQSAMTTVGSVIGEKLRQYLLGYQWRWVQDDSPMKLGRKSRRAGWTYAEALRSVIQRLRTKRDHWFSSADETAALEFIEYCRFWSDFIGQAAKIVDDREIFDRRNGVNLHRLVFANGRRITALTSNPRQFRSKGGDATWDEAAYHDDPEGMWKAIQPTVLWGGQLSIFSNPNTEGDMFDQLCAEAEGVQAGRLNPDRDNVPDWSYYRVTIEDAVEAGLAEKVLGLKARDDEARKKFLKSCRAKARDTDTWQREYMCTSTGESNVLLSYAMIAACSRPAEELLGKYSGGLLYAGFDVGREHDLSVFAVAEMVSGVLFARHLESFSKTEYRLQKQAVMDFWRSHPIRRFCGDATGIGDNLVEDLQYQYRRRVEKVKFTAEVKEDLALGLLQRFEDRSIWVPDTRPVREALHKIRKMVTKSGNVRYDAARTTDGHADEFWALALAGDAAGRKPARVGSQPAKPAGW